MANTASAKKAIRVSARNAVVNKRTKVSYKHAKKQVLKAVAEGDKKKALKLLPQAYKQIDKAAKKILHKKTAARYKSRLAAKVNAVK